MEFLRKRAKWYKKYHLSPRSQLLHWCVLVLSLFVLLAGYKDLIYFADANSVTTTITQKIFPGRIGIIVPSVVVFSPITGSLEKQQLSHARLTGLHITDFREDANTSWVVTASCSDFYSINQPVKIAGNNDTIVADGIYNSSRGGVYTITITKSGRVGEAHFSVRGLENVDDKTTGTNIPLGSRGALLSFANANYELGDSWNLRIDTIPVTGLTIFPQNLSTDTSLQGISLGSMHTFTDSTDIAAVLKADNTHVAGDFFVDLDLTLLIPSFTYANSYSTTLTITAD